MRSLSFTRSSFGAGDRASRPRRARRDRRAAAARRSATGRRLATIVTPRKRAGRHDDVGDPLAALDRGFVRRSISRPSRAAPRGSRCASRSRRRARAGARPRGASAASAAKNAADDGSPGTVDVERRRASDGRRCRPCCSFDPDVDAAAPRACARCDRASALGSTTSASTPAHERGEQDRALHLRARDFAVPLDARAARRRESSSAGRRARELERARPSPRAAARRAASAGGSGSRRRRSVASNGSAGDDAGHQPRASCRCCRNRDRSSA